MVRAAIICDSSGHSFIVWPADDCVKLMRLLCGSIMVLQLSSQCCSWSRMDGLAGAAESSAQHHAAPLRAADCLTNCSQETACKVARHTMCQSADVSRATGAHKQLHRPIVQPRLEAADETSCHSVRRTHGNAGLPAQI